MDDVDPHRTGTSAAKPQKAAVPVPEELRSWYHVPVERTTAIGARIQPYIVVGRHRDIATDAPLHADGWSRSVPSAMVTSESQRKFSTSTMSALGLGRTVYSDPKTQTEMLDRLSPIYRLDRITAAVMVRHGTNDTNVPVVEAEQIVKALKERGVPVEYVLFPDEGHGFRKIPNRIKSTVEMVRFFSEHL